MSESVVVALIAAISGVLAAMLGRSPPPPRTAARRRLTWFLLGAGAGLVLALIGFGIGRVCCDGGPELSIESPKMDETVPSRQIEVRGTWSSVSDADEPRLVIYVPELDLFYPDAELIDLYADGEWSAMVVVGGPDDSEEEFQIIATTSASEGQNAIGEYLDRGRESGDWPGMRPLPGGVTRHDSVSVVRE